VSLFLATGIVGPFPLLEASSFFCRLAIPVESAGAASFSFVQAAAAGALLARFSLLLGSFPVGSNFRFGLSLRTVVAPTADLWFLLAVPAAFPAFHNSNCSRRVSWDAISIVVDEGGGREGGGEGGGGASERERHPFSKKSTRCSCGRWKGKGKEVDQTRSVDENRRPKTQS
jgi:hypothetical protein